MTSNRDQIKEAVITLGLGEEHFQVLEGNEMRAVYESALSRFVTGKNPQWWWEHFTQGISMQFLDGDGWRHISRIAPNPDEEVWFIAEDWVSPNYSVWSAKVREVEEVIGECSPFEFYIVSHDFRWLICENHHDVVFAVGIEVEERLRRFKDPKQNA
jgi:hypothetical protein